MAMQGTWLRAQVRYDLLPLNYFVVLIVLPFMVAVLLSAPQVGWAFAIGLPAAVTIVFILAIYLALKPFQGEVSFIRGHVFWRGRGSWDQLARNYVKPSRATQTGLIVDVRSNIRGFRISFRNDQDVTLFIGWLKDAGVPIAQAAR